MQIEFKNGSIIERIKQNSKSVIRSKKREYVMGSDKFYEQEEKEEEKRSSRYH